MTRSEEESLLLSLQSADPATVLGTLQKLKHRLIGHDQTKELFVRLGIADVLSAILSNDAYGEDAKVEASIAIGSLAYGMRATRSDPQ